MIDEVPVLAAAGRARRGERPGSWAPPSSVRRRATGSPGVAEGLRALGGHAGVEGDDLVVPGLGLRGGRRRQPAATIGWRWRSRSRRSRRTRRARSRAWRPRTCRSPGSSTTLRALGASVEDVDVTRLEVIAIDGAAGSGKSTLATRARRGARPAVREHGHHVSSADARRARRRASIPTTAQRSPELMSRLRFGLSTGVPPEIEVEGSPAVRALESERVEAEVSHVARHPQVRALMREGQRALGLPRRGGRGSRHRLRRVPRRAGQAVPDRGARTRAASGARSSGGRPIRTRSRRRCADATRRTRR